MATLYKNRGVWYITASYENQRLTRSLRTKSKKVARKIKSGIELELLKELTGVSNRKMNLQKITLQCVCLLFIGSTPRRLGLVGLNFVEFIELKKCVPQFCVPFMAINE